MVPLTRLFMNTQTKIHNENWKWSHEAKYGTFPHAPLQSLTHTHTQIHTRFPKHWQIWKTSALPCQSGELKQPSKPSKGMTQQLNVSVVFLRHPAHRPILFLICSFIHQSYAMVRKIHLFPVRTLFGSWTHRKGTFEMEPGWCQSRTRVIGRRDSAGAFWLALDLLILVTPSSAVWTRHPLAVYTLTSNRLWAKQQITLTVCNSPKRMHYMINDKGWQMLWP